MAEKVALFVQLYGDEDKMLKEILSKYSYHSKAEFIRDVIKKIYKEGKIELIPTYLQPLGMEKSITP